MSARTRARHGRHRARCSLSLPPVRTAPSGRLVSSPSVCQAERTNQTRAERRLDSSRRHTHRAQPTFQHKHAHRLPSACNAHPNMYAARMSAAAGGRRAAAAASAGGGRSAAAISATTRRLFTPVHTRVIARYTPPGFASRTTLGCAHSTRLRGFATLAAADATQLPPSRIQQPSSAHSESSGSERDAHHRSSNRTVLLVAGGAAVGLYLWSRSRVAGEGALAPPLPSLPTAQALAAVDDPLAVEKLPSLIKEHYGLSFWRRLWFYGRLACRAMLLSTVWVPVLLSGLILPQHLWMRVVVRLAERCGAVFIKLAQWAATRPDLFPDEVCEQLSKLQAEVRPHKFARSLEACRSNFGPDLQAADGSRLVLTEEVLGSGSMGQVHRGFVVSPDGSTRTEVAIKVLHPHIHSLVNLDLTLLYFVAAAITKIPYSELQWVSIPEMLIQFTEFMGSHLNLVQEAHNMTSFRHNFRNKSEPDTRTPTHACPMRSRKHARHRAPLCLDFAHIPLLLCLCRAVLWLCCACRRFQSQHSFPRPDVPLRRRASAGPRTCARHPFGAVPPLGGVLDSTRRRRWGELVTSFEEPCHKT